MSDNGLKQKIRDMLKQKFFSDPEDLVDVSDGPFNSIHLVVVSHKIARHGFKDKNDIIWDLLTANLQPEEWGKVSLSIGTSPEEIKAL